MERRSPRDPILPHENPDYQTAGAVLLVLGHRVSGGGSVGGQLRCGDVAQHRAIRDTADPLPSLLEPWQNQSLDHIVSQLCQA